MSTPTLILPHRRGRRVDRGFSWSVGDEPVMKDYMENGITFSSNFIFQLEPLNSSPSKYAKPLDGFNLFPVSDASLFNGSS